MGNLDAALKRYYRNISKELPCSRKTKAQIMQQIQSSVNLFMEQNPSADFDTVQAHFGEPKTIAWSYIEDQEAPELLRKMQIKKRILAIVAGTLTLVLLIWAAAMAWAIVDATDTSNGYYNIVITEE